MEVEQAAAAVAYLTSMTSGWNDDATEQMVYEFERIPDGHALVEAIAKVARTWTSSSRPPLGVIMDAYHHEVRMIEQRERERLERQTASIRCDGSGWLTDPDETIDAGERYRPCPTCNPAIAAIWLDRDKKRAWRSGAPLHRLLDFDTRKDMIDEHSHMKCPPPETERNVTTVDGMTIALDAYRAEFNREPSDAVVALLHAAAARVPEPDPREEPF